MYIVAPAGDIDKFYAAIDGGAHEIYMGLEGFGARKNAKNFSLVEYKFAIDYAHERGCRVLLTLNTIMMDEEFSELFESLNALYKAGLDAVIVQDLGMFKYLKDNFPEIEIHGSTQMTVSNHVEAEYLRELGFKRVVLSRELSFKEIEEIKKNTSIELEIFVSGALCVSFSGKCYMSSFLGGRSGNRGVCAQPCRKPYTASNAQKGYFISPKDQLMQKQEIDLLKSIGIEAIKIEGRMKEEKYVYELTDYFKKLIDGEEREERVSKIFNRGYGKGYFYDNSEIINKNYSSNLGEKIGIVSGKEILLSENLKFGDKVIYASKNYEKLGGTNISKINIKKSGKKFRSSDPDKDREANSGDTIIIQDLPTGTRYLFKSFSKEVDEVLGRERHESKRKIPVKGEFICKIDKNPILKLSYAKSKDEIIEVEVTDERAVEAAAKKGVTSRDIFEKISELGDTTFSLLSEDFSCHVGENLFLPLSIIKSMRREAVEKLSKKIVESYRREGVNAPKLLEINKDKEKGSFLVKVIVSNKRQESIAREFGIKNIYHRNSQIITEKDLDKKREESSLAYNLYDIATVKKEEKVTVHWGLNISNSYAISVLEKIPGIESVMISPELSFEMIKRLGKSSLKKALLIYGKLKVMHIGTEIFSGEESLVNDMGDEFKVCKEWNNHCEIYLKTPLDVTDKLEEIKSIFIDEVVLEFLDETDEEIRAILEKVTKEGVRKDSKTENTRGYNYWKGVF